MIFVSLSLYCSHKSNNNSSSLSSRFWKLLSNEQFTFDAAPSPTATMAFPESSKATIASRKENTANAINNQNVGTGNDVQPGNYGLSEAASNRPRFASYASGASTPECNSDIDDEAIPVVNCNGPRAGEPSSTLAKARFERKTSNPKALIHSSSKVGLDEMIEDRRETGHIGLNVVHIEVPFGKPIEEVYDGVHNGPVLGSGISGLVRLVTHKATGIKYAVKVLDLGLLETAEGLNQLREEIFIMCQVSMQFMPIPHSVKEGVADIVRIAP